MSKLIRPSCWHQNFVPWGLSAPAQGLYTCIKSWKKLYKIILKRHFLETCHKWMKWLDISVWHQNFVCWGLSAPAPWLYTCIKSWITLYKIRHHRNFFETCNKWPKWHKTFVPKGLSAPALWLYTCFCWHQKFVPWGCMPLTCSYIHLSNHEKMCIKSEVEKILFKLAANDHSDSCWHKNFGLNGLSAPAQGLCLNFFSSITADFNISSALRWVIQDQWSSGLL